MASFSITEKLAIAGAFLAVVAMVVGTEDDPGVLVTSDETVAALRTSLPARRAAPVVTTQPVVIEVAPEPVFAASAPEPQYPPPPLASRATTRGALENEDRAPVARPRSYGSSAPTPATDLR